MKLQKYSNVASVTFFRINLSNEPDRIYHSIFQRKIKIMHTYEKRVIDSSKHPFC